MAKSSATRGQQIGIWIIAIAMTLGTVVSFVAIIFQNENAAIDQQRQAQSEEEQLAEFQRQQLELAEARAANAEPLEGYSASSFDASSVTELGVRVLNEGDGAVVAVSDTIEASYFGWISDGRIFDSTNTKDTENTPIAFPLSGVIKGWTDGLTGQKVGSTVELTIPASLAYGANANGIIPANAPLKFIVIIESIEETA